MQYAVCMYVSNMLLIVKKQLFVSERLSHRVCKCRSRTINLVDNLTHSVIEGVGM